MRIEVVRIDISLRMSVSIGVVGCNELKKKDFWITELLVLRLLLPEKIRYKKFVILLCFPSSVDPSIILTSLGQKQLG